MVVTLKGELVGLGQALMGSEDILEARHGLAVRMLHVLAEQGVYPKRGGQGG